MEFRTIEGLPKGSEVPFKNKDGQNRRDVRIRWWELTATTYRNLALLQDAMRVQLPALPLKSDTSSRYDNVKPVFFGRYWITGVTTMQTPTSLPIEIRAGRP
jgi:hypothetical protein